MGGYISGGSKPINMNPKTKKILRLLKRTQLKLTVMNEVYLRQQIENMKAENPTPKPVKFT